MSHYVCAALWGLCADSLFGHWLQQPARTRFVNPLRHYNESDGSLVRSVLIVSVNVEVASKANLSLKALFHQQFRRHAANYIRQLQSQFLVLGVGSGHQFGKSDTFIWKKAHEAYQPRLQQTI